MAGGQQVGGERVAAVIGLAVTRREVAGQAVAVQITRELRRHRLPEFAVTQADGFAGFLLQAGKRVVGKPVLHTRQTFGQLGLQRHFQAAATG